MFAPSETPGASCASRETLRRLPAEHQLESAGSASITSISSITNISSITSSASFKRAAAGVFKSYPAQGRRDRTTAYLNLRFAYLPNLGNFVCHKKEAKS